MLKSAAEREPDVADVASSETSGTKRKSSCCTSVDEVCGDGAESSVDSGGGKGKSGDGGGGLGGVGNDGGGVEGVEDSDTKAREVPKRKRSRARAVRRGTSLVPVLVITITHVTGTRVFML